MTVDPATTRVGWIGTGVMGLSMCGHVLEAGYAVQIVPEFLRGAQITVLVAGPTYLRDRAVAEAFMRALLRGLNDLATQGWNSPENAAIVRSAPPQITDSSPEAARSVPPLTGASTIAMPRAASSAPRRLTVSGSIVLMQITM